MTYAIVFSSRTGNTKLLADTLLSALPGEECIYWGEPSPEALKAERLYVGFWTDKGTCDEGVASFLHQVTDQQVFLFGTAGFGGAPAYFDQILARVEANLEGRGTVVGRFMCQGRMPQAVRDRYEAMEESPRRTAMLENFDRALSHPDQADLDALRAAL